MNIAIDGRTIAKNRTGVGSYAERLVRSLLQYDQTNHYYLYLVEPNEHFEAPNLTKILIVGYERALLNRYWENFILPADALKEYDLYFDPAYALPFLPQFGPLTKYLPLPAYWHSVFNSKRTLKYVVTIHDVISFVFPQYFTSKMRMWQNFFVWNAQKTADWIIADSHSTKNDLARFYPSLKEKVGVVYPELDENFKVVTDSKLLNDTRSEYHLPDKYILYVGTIEPRKNVAGIARAYSQLPKQIRDEFPLVVGGNIGWYAESILSEIRSLNIGSNVHFIGYVRDAFLPSLFTMASVFVFPSFYEGFGYPPLEAMACGVPVISSNRSSLPEAVGEAAVLIDPESNNQLRDAMLRILTDRTIQTELRQKGFEQVKKFNWKKCAVETLEVFERIHRS